MAEVENKKLDVVDPEVDENDVKESPIKEKKVVEEKPEKENGDACDNNGKEAEETDPDSNEAEELVCPVKRKSTADIPDGKPAEGVSPEKKAKLDDVSAEVEANGDTEVVA